MYDWLQLLLFVFFPEDAESDRDKEKETSNESFILFNPR